MVQFRQKQPSIAFLKEKNFRETVLTAWSAVASGKIRRSTVYAALPPILLASPTRAAVEAAIPPRSPTPFSIYAGNFTADLSKVRIFAPSWEEQPGRQEPHAGKNAGLHFQ